VTGRQGRRHKLLVDDRKGKRSYCELNKGRTISYFLEYTLLRRLRNCLKKGIGMDGRKEGRKKERKNE
jgi:hypothetical protein